MKNTPLIPLLLLFWTSCTIQNNNETSATLLVNDQTGTDQCLPFQVHLVEEELPFDLSSGPIRNVISTYQPEIGEQFEVSFEAKNRDKFSYYLLFDELNGYYNSGRSENGNSYSNRYKCNLAKGESKECVMQLEPCYLLEVETVNMANIDGDSIYLQISESLIGFTHTYSGQGSSPIAAVRMPYGHQTLNYQVYENGELILDHEEQFFARHNLDTLITVEF